MFVIYTRRSSITHISEHLALDKSTVNRFVEKMEKQGYLYRAARDDDRGIGIFPTDECQQISSRLDEISTELNEAVRTLLGKALLSDAIECTQQASARL